MHDLDEMRVTRRGSLWRLAVVWGALFAVACGSAPQRVGSAPSWRGATPKVGAPADITPVVFAPGAPAVAQYNLSEPPPQPSALGKAVIDAVLEEAALAKVTAPTIDARLFRTCAELAQIVPEEGVVAYRVVEFAMQRHGIIEPSPHLLVVWGSLSDPAAIVAQLRPRFAEMFARGAPARVGVGEAVRAANGEGAVVFALQASAVTTAPIPRSVAAGKSFRIKGKVAARFSGPSVLVTDERGDTITLPMKSNLGPGEISATLSCVGRQGRQQVEISASDHTGATVLANFPVWCGEEPPTSIQVAAAEEDPAPATAGEAEQRLFAQVNESRRRVGLPELVWDEAVAKVARGHSEEMRRTQVVAHLSPTTGSAADRLRAAKLKSAVVLENVARAYGVSEVHAGLMGSPGHRQNILSRAATAVGIGVIIGEVVSGRPELFVTQVFTRVDVKIDEAKAAQQLYAMISPKGTLRRVPALDEVAQRVARNLATGTPPERAWEPVAAELKALGRTYPKIGTIITAAADLSMLDPKSLVPGVVNGLGLGLAQGPHPDQGEGALWIVLLLGETAAK